MVRELQDLFGSGNDSVICELGRDFAVKEREWKNMTSRLRSLFMPTSYKNAVEAIEYGYELNGSEIAPTPFMRTTGKRNEKRWKEKLDELAARYVLIGENVNRLIDSLEDEIRLDLYETANEFGVPENVSEVFKMKFKKNYRGVQMVEWIHGGSKNPREYHEREWDGHTGKINGRPNGLNGYIFPIDKPPVIEWDKDGKEIRGFPGDLPHCSCLIVPIFV